MTRKNSLFFTSLFLVLFLCSCVKKVSSGLPEESTLLNDNITEEFTTIKHSDIAPSVLGRCSLNSEDMNKIASSASHKIILNSTNQNNLKLHGVALSDNDVKAFSQIDKSDPDMQKNYGLTNKQMIQIEREDRRNTYDKTNSNPFPLKNKNFLF